MKYKNYTISFAVFLSLLILAAPLAIWEAFLGDSIYDSVFSESLSAVPVLKAGRVMPASSAAADSLRSLSGRDSVKFDGNKISATKWLWLMGAQRDKMAAQPIFRTDNRDLQKLMGVGSRNYSYNDFAKRYGEIYSSAVSGERTPYARACEDAVTSALAYAILANSFGVELPNVVGSKKAALAWRDAIAAARNEYESAHTQKREAEKEKLTLAADYLSKLHSNADFEKQYPNEVVRAIPSGKTFATPSETLLDKNLDWNKNGGAAEALLAYCSLLDDIAKLGAEGKPAEAKEKIAHLVKILKQNTSIDFFKIDLENIVNRLDLFFGGFILYLSAGAFLLFSAFFKNSAKIQERMRLIAKIILMFAVGAQCGAILVRMYIQMRPPVTNLYSSVVFTGALASLGALVFFIKNKGMTFAISCVSIGALSILVAMNLPHSGDTMGMMRAVLNSNFWLTVHVVTIMVGYCGVFLAGSIAAMRLIANLFDKGDFGEATGATAKNVYSILCFALMFSFLGTMLGGVWADMSWGRFWGWDPKENGALMIVLWCAAAIHSKALRLVGDRIFLALAVVGNIIAAWAWFGVNLMGVGLHSYGFVEGGWKWFFIFVAANALVIPLALVKYRGDKR